MSSHSIINLGGAKGRRVLDKIEGFGTSVGAESTFVGTISGAGHCLVQGVVEGDCDITGTLVISAQGRWTGNISANNVLVGGKVVGNVVAREKLELISTGHITGMIQSPVIAIAEGAVHQGEVRMGGASQLTHFSEQRKR